MNSTHKESTECACGECIRRQQIFLARLRYAEGLEWLAFRMLDESEQVRQSFIFNVVLAQEHCI
jgi:hypothetical protein